MSTARDMPDAQRVRPRGRAARLALAAMAIGLLLDGTASGGDLRWPFGPFSMYAGWYPPNGVISSNLVRAETADGREVYVTQDDTGVARAEIEDELTRFETNPDLLADLAAAYHRRHPDASPYVRVWIEQTRWQLHDRSVVRHWTVVVAQWKAT
jgi:hypothetical protein